MRLLFWRKPEPSQQREGSEGAFARARAEAALEQAKAQRPAVSLVSQSLRELKEENHFAERVAWLIQGGKE